MILAMALASAPLTAAPITGGMSDPDGRLRENETVSALGGCPGGGQLHDATRICRITGLLGNTADTNGQPTVTISCPRIAHAEGPCWLKPGLTGSQYSRPAAAQAGA